jgi:hypothetical protein
LIKFALPLARPATISRALATESEQKAISAAMRLVKLELEISREGFGFLSWFWCVW